MSADDEDALNPAVLAQRKIELEVSSLENEFDAIVVLKRKHQAEAFTIPATRWLPYFWPSLATSNSSLIELILANCQRQIPSSLTQAQLRSRHPQMVYWLSSKARQRMSLQRPRRIDPSVFMTKAIVSAFTTTPWICR